MFSLFRKSLELVVDHLELAELESRYEWEQGKKSLVAWFGIAICAWGVYALFLVALVDILTRLNLPLYAACFSLILFHLLVGFGIYQAWGNRDPKVGLPFEGSRNEFKKTVQWIQTHIS
jgi:hypothetical protein